MMMNVKKRQAQEPHVSLEFLEKKRRVGEEFESLKMVARGYYFPKINFMKPLGEDANFICEEKKNMGVADGVDGWARKGIDAGDYAHELMKNVTVVVKEEAKDSVDPKRVLNHAFMNTNAKGSSTASIVSLKKNVLHGVNVGDSGLMLFRNNIMLYQSPIQNRKFNTLFQLGNVVTSDRPDSAVEYKVLVEPRDVIVLGTGGVFENLYPFEIEVILKDMTEEGRLMDVQECAKVIASMAWHLSMSKLGGPFEDACKKVGVNHKGGKMDDITVLVAHIIV